MKAHLAAATGAIKDATDALKQERKTRSAQISLLVAALVLTIVVGVVGFIAISSTNKRACEAINQNKETIDTILVDIASEGGGITPEEQEILDRLRVNLVPQEC